MLAWHFVGKTLRDGRPVPKNGEWLIHDGPIELCVSGLHASIEPFDALRYAPGGRLCLVECQGITQKENDKFVCRRRKIIARINATEIIQYFIRMRALSVIHIWDAPDIVIEYLMTGDRSIRNAAQSATQPATWSAAQSATWSAAQSAAWFASQSAVWLSAWFASQSAIHATSWFAAQTAGYATSWHAAHTAGQDAARKEFNFLVFETFSEYL